MNRVILMGRLTRDPIVRYSQGERSMAIANYTLAVDRRGRRSQDGDQGQTADFINIVAFDRAGEFAEKYFRQGMRVLVSGRIQTGSYVNKDGQKVYTTEVVVDDQEFADSKNQGGDNGSFGGGSYGGGQGYGGGYGNNQNYSAGQSQGGSYQQGTRPAPSAAIGDGFMNIPDGVEDEGLPFN
ncbi:MAG: single-stranded DNA-binding protein [Lachnospiraceae bacterium]|nr:single-stranded DNA-binding protein [Lachnospiraceae bacterium]NBJ81987.1 single-stranded DNA-binding protein [bacterium 1XD42-76]NBK04554.1 single-stranded DNA-binding protein [bacterium 1XD42-94]